MLFSFMRGCISKGVIENKLHRKSRNSINQVLFCIVKQWVFFLLLRHLLLLLLLDHFLKASFSCPTNHMAIAWIVFRFIEDFQVQTH